jgi:hypothetical protein
MEIATVSGEGHWVKNLGYSLNTSLDWTRQWQHLQAKLGAAALVMRQAATGRACHLAITALLTQHDVGSCLPYSLMATGTKRGDLEGARSTLLEPVRQRAGLPKTATAHAMLCGDLSDKGTGITDSLALNAGVKCSALLHILNGSRGHAIRALLHMYNSVHPKDRPTALSRPGAQPALQRHACPTVTEGLGAIAEPPGPGSSAVWHLVTCRPPGALTVRELISNNLPTNMPAPYRKCLEAFLMLRLDSALRMAQADVTEQRPTPPEDALLDEQPPATMGRLLYPTSYDPDCSEAGSAASPAGAEQLLTRGATEMHAALPRGVQGSVGAAIHTGLLALCSSTYLHVHTAHMHALHARRHDPPLAGGTPLSPHHPTGDVEVDGSYHPHTGTAAAGVAYLVRRQDGLLEVHITNATFAGAQSAQDAEVAALALSLRLAPLQRVQHSTSAGTA